jgi:hypothetical protein
MKFAHRLTLAGAAVETALSGGYNVCQFFNLRWGKNLPPKSVPVFTGTWVAMSILAVVIALTGVRPLAIGECIYCFWHGRHAIHLLPDFADRI